MKRSYSIAIQAIEKEIADEREVLEFIKEKKKNHKDKTKNDLILYDRAIKYTYNEIQSLTNGINEIKQIKYEQ